MTRSAATLAVTLCALFVAPVDAQSLTTTFVSNNGQSGNMFDLVGLGDVTVNDLDVNLDSGSWSVEVYVTSSGGSFTGNETDPSAWTLLATASVSSAGLNNVTNLGLSLGHSVSAGQTQGFYVTVNSGAGMNYTNGTSQGAVYASDANMQILEGVGKSYPFGATFTPRVWNGTIHYTTGPPVGQLVATTTGVGDLVLSGPSDPPGTTEGYVLLSNDTSGPIGAGPLVGLYPDSLTFSIFGIPASVGNIFHYVPSPTQFPNVDFVLPPGSLPPGVSYDGVLVQMQGGIGALTVSNVARIAF